MGLVLIVAAVVNGQVPALGADDWETREAATARLDHTLAAWFLPAAHHDPEINYRLRGLRAKNLRWADPQYVERVVFRRDFGAWVRLYLTPNRSIIAPEWDTFADIHGDHGKANAVFALWPVGGASEMFLRGRIESGEYERYLEFLDYNRGVAPVPRELTSDR